MSAPGETLELGGGGQAIFTSRVHGNLSSVGGDGSHEGALARERLRELIGARGLLRGYQAHGTTVRRVSHDPSPDSEVPAEEADGQATNVRGLAAIVLSADCLPVALGCDGAVAALHAGWRGLAAGVLEQGVIALRELGAREGQITAVVGPGAGPCCYEVGEEVHVAFAGRHRHGQNIDLRAIAHERLLAAGVAEVRDVQACTICDERYFSHRREGRRAGRQGVAMWLS
ncbi:MAG TPA: polyphenol oxidase family protein [Solirubrobacteraceae bacterium]